MTFQGAVGVPFASNTTIGSGLDRAKKLCLMSKHWSQKRNQCFYMNQTDQTRAILTANLEGQLDSGVWVRIIVLHFAQQFGPPRSGRVGEAAQPPFEKLAHRLCEGVPGSCPAVERVCAVSKAGAAPRRLTATPAARDSERRERRHRFHTFAQRHCFRSHPSSSSAIRPS